MLTRTKKKSQETKNGKGKVGCSAVEATRVIFTGRVVAEKCS